MTVPYSTRPNDNIYTAGTGISLANGSFSIGQDISPNQSVTFGGLTVNGNTDHNGEIDLNINGNTGNKINFCSGFHIEGGKDFALDCQNVSGGQKDCVTLTTGGWFGMRKWGNWYAIYTTAGWLSDDRMKFNEVSLTDDECINVMKKLNPQSYDKVKELGDGLGVSVHNQGSETERVNLPFKETGFIAQDVEKINELAHAVTKGDNNNAYHIKYENIIAYNTGAIKALINKVENLTKRCEELESRVPHNGASLP